MNYAQNVMAIESRGEFQVELGEAVSGVHQLIAVKSDAEGYVATDIAGLVVMGVNLKDGAEGDNVTVAQGIWVLENDTVAPVTDAYIGKKCYFKDARTVTTSTGSHSVIVGTVKKVIANVGVAVDLGVDTSATPSS